MSVSAAASILNFGAMGLAFLFGYLAYKLLKENPNPFPQQTRLIMAFMALNALIAVGAGFLQFALSSVGGGTIVRGWGISLGKTAHDAFFSGGTQTNLAGTWKVLQYEADGKPAQITKPDGTTIPYPEESVDCKHEGVLFSCMTKFTVGETSRIWGEGRIAPGNNITFMFWTPPDGPERTIVGVHFLSIKEAFGSPLTLEGYYYGTSRDNKTANGRIVWKKG